MRVPEAAVNKYNLTARRKYQVRLPWEILSVKAKAIAESVHEASNRELRQRILAADCAHVLTAIHLESDLKLFKQPFQNRTLLFLARPSDLRKEPDRRGLHSCNILRALVAGRAKRPEIG